MATPKLRILPLGGLGEIGKNMMVVEYDSRIVVVDTGLMFPTSEMLGIDLVLPDFSYLREREADIEAIVITHGHEDHVGALPYVLRELEVPAIYGSSLTAGMARSKLDEHKIGDPPLEAIDAGQVVEAGPFTLEMVHVSHSIPQSRAVLLGCELGSVLVTGDYKFDQTPVDGQPTDVTRLAQIGERGELILLCGDSTNADRSGMSLSESSVGPVLEGVFARCPGRIIITTFASNIHRVQQVIEAAGELGRKVCVIGRSMRKFMNVAKNLGIIDVPEGMLIAANEVDSFHEDRIVVLSTGSQGEPLSALRRMAHRDHPQLSLHEGDTVIFSATPIPGNELAVNETINRLYRIGCDVITTDDADVHASGHGYGEEIKMMLNLTKPRYVMPAHGDGKRLILHGRLAEQTGVDSDRIFIGANGLPLAIDGRGAGFEKSVGSSVIFVDGIDVGDVKDAALRDRRMISADGIIVAVVTVSADDGKQIAEPEIIFRGVPFVQREEELQAELAQEIDTALTKAAHEDIQEIGLLQQLLHDQIAQFSYRQLKRRPMVLPVVIEV